MNEYKVFVCKKDKVFSHLYWGEKLYKEWYKKRYNKIEYRFQKKFYYIYKLKLKIFIV